MDAEWLLSTDDKWVQKYFDSSDLHSVGSATLSLIFFRVARRPVAGRSLSSLGFADARQLTLRL
jgi:hypothetical protein